MEYLVHIATLVTIFAILGLGLNLVVGYTGLVSSGHAAFYGIGAYATAIWVTTYHGNFFVSLVIGIIVALISSFVVGLILSRFKDDFYVLGSIGLNIIVLSVFLNWTDLTHGPLGIPGIARPNLLGLTFQSNYEFLFLALIILLLVYLLTNGVVQSSFGRVLKAIREDEKAISVFGYRTQYYKLVVFMIGAATAAVAGSLVASYITYIDPTSFALNESILILAIVILGGLASLRGSLLGALFLILLPEALRFVGFPNDIAAQMRQVVYGLLLVILMLYRPQGLIGEYKL